jgi:hypothetical protein
MEQNLTQFGQKLWDSRTDFENLDSIVELIGMYQYAQSAHATICSALTQPLATRERLRDLQLKVA